MRASLLFVRPPRPVWPFHGLSTAFWPPLAFASMASALRAGAPDLDVGILDAPALEMGWHTLESELRRRRPTLLAMGEEADVCVESFRLARLAHSIDARVIVGGTFFEHVARESLATQLVDVVVHGEGESTIVDLANALAKGAQSRLPRIAGISFLEPSGLVTTPPRQVVSSLDDLPFPAYDLLPCHRYGAESQTHPHIASIEMSRGDPITTEPFRYWKPSQFPFPSPMQPPLRLKSPERLVEEVRILVRKHDRQYLGWVDPCLNTDAQVPGEFAELLLHQNLALGQSAWARPDGIIRDASTGALAACVQSGLNEISLVVERTDRFGRIPEGDSHGIAQTREAVDILRRRFPSVFILGAFPYGFPDDSRATINTLYHKVARLDLDAFLFVPLVALPGTPGWDPGLWDPTGEDMRRLHFLPDSTGNEHLRELEEELNELEFFYWPASRIHSLFGHLACRHSRRRRLRWLLLSRTIRFHARNLVRKATLGPEESPLLVFPRWYEN